MTWFRRMTAVAALAVVVVLGLVAPAVAAPLTIDWDRSDNTYSFEYEPATGEIGGESSSLRFSTRDPVTFLVYIREAVATPEPERLKARFSLTLNSNKVVRYEGTFSLVVKNSAGIVVLRKQVQRKVVLRPQAGQRTARFSLPFDLDLYDLNYQAKGVFQSS